MPEYSFKAVVLIDGRFVNSHITYIAALSGSSRFLFRLGFS